MSTVFISYRRKTAAGEARALFNDLVAKLGKSSVFMDVHSIALGRDFRSVLHNTLESCDLMLVVIDKNWVQDKDEQGRTRLNDPKDFVRMEVEAALKRDIVVTPVLVQGASMPTASELPPEIADLAYRSGFELSHTRWESDFEEMMRRLNLKRPQPPKPPGILRWFIGGVAIMVAATAVIVSLTAKSTKGPPADSGVVEGPKIDLVPNAPPVPDPFLVSPPDSLWDHNQSDVLLKINGDEVKIIYVRPKPEMENQGARSGTRLFLGKRSGDALSGIAYRFDRRCGATAYEVRGLIVSAQKIVLDGRTPIGLDSSCRVIRYLPSDTLVFERKN